MPTLADAIIDKNENAVRDLLRNGAEINVVDEYGFTPLIEAMIADNANITQLLLREGARVNLKDMIGTSPLHWAAENNNVTIAKMLLEKKADLNAFNLSGQPVMVMPVLRDQTQMKQLLQSYGADLDFARDFINTKMLGHLFELVGVGCIISPDNQFVEVDFEGFLPEVTLTMISDSVEQFKNHYAARRVRRYTAVAQTIVDVMHRAAKLIRYQQYRIDRSQFQNQITRLIEEKPLIIPVSYEGHAITFIHYLDLLIKCDRRVESRLYDNIVIYRIGRPSRLNSEAIQKLIYTQQNFISINEALPAYLNLQPVTEIKVPAQISGNCSWANVEACIPALFYVLLASENSSSNDIKTQALQFFDEWREWNKDRSLQFCIQRFHEMDPLRRAAQAEILSAILFQTCTGGTARDNERAERIITTLKESEYAYVLKNYARSYAFEDIGFEGQRFIRLLQKYGFDPRVAR